MTTKFHIKNMVSQRCKIVVKQELKKFGLRHLTVDMGLVDIIGVISEQKNRDLKFKLLALGLEVIDNKRDILVERIVNAVIEMIHDDTAPQANYSDVINEKIVCDYTNLSKVFSKDKGITLQQYIIHCKVERVKELLLYEQLNLTEISHKLHYSSVGHLSNQFKKITGFSSTAYVRRDLKLKASSENTGYV